MIAGQFVIYGKDYADLCRQLGKEDEAKRAEKLVADMVEAVKKHGWDGEWYLRAYDYYGKKVGSHENKEAKIFIESQGWCTMAGIGLEEGMVKKSLDSVRTILLSLNMLLNMEKFPHIQKDTKKMVQSSHIITHGLSLEKLF